jgi:hypothetical protein
MKNVLAKVEEEGMTLVSDVEETWLGFEVTDGDAVAAIWSSTCPVLVIPDVPVMSSC